MISWVDKHRPVAIANYLVPAGKDGTKLVNLLTKRHPKNILLFGPPGTGKTTFARLYAKKFGADIGSGSTSFLELTASDVKGVEEVRTIVAPLVEGWCFDGDYTFIFLEECDTLTKAAKVALKPLMERNKNTVFILTTNDLSTVDAALRSRCSAVHCFLGDDDTPRLYNLLLGILNKENINYNKPDVMEIAMGNRHDIRAAISELEDIYR